MVLDCSFANDMPFFTPVIEETVLFPTVSVKVHAGRRSGTIRGRVAWSSQFNLISEKCRKRFNLPLLGGGMPSIHSVGGTATEITGRSRIKFSPHFDEEHALILEVFVVEKIKSTLISERLHPMIRGSLYEFELSDPLFDEPGEMDFLLGVTFWPLLLKEGRYLIPGTSCYAIDTILGWIVMGRAPLDEYELDEVPPLQNYLCTH